MNRPCAGIASVCAALIWIGCGKSPQTASTIPQQPTPAANGANAEIKAPEVDPPRSPAPPISEPTVDQAETVSPDESGSSPTEPDSQPDEPLLVESGAQPNESDPVESGTVEPDAEDGAEADAEIEKESVVEAPSFRMLLPTTSGPLVVDVDIRIGDEPIAAMFDARVQAVMDEASDSSDLTWRKLFEHVASDREQFGRASQVNSNQYRNLIRLYDRNRNKKPDKEEVVRFLFRNAKYAGPFWLIGSDYFREINRTQSAVFAAMDRNDDRFLEPDEIDQADESIYRLDRNGDRRIDLNEVAPLPEDDKAVWKNQRSGRWGQVAMALSGYIDWQMLSYNLDEVTRGGVFGGDENLIAKLDQDGDGSVDAEEARSLASIRPDARLLVQYPRVAAQPAEIEIVSVSGEIEQHGKRTSSGNQISIDGDSLRLIARVIDRRTGRNQIPPEAFAALDANNDGGLDESEIPEPALQEYSFEDLDEDEDGKLTLQEIHEGMSPKTPIWNVQVRARGAESPDAVFAWLDQNQDFVLSTREVLSVVDRLRKMASPEGNVRPADIPDSFVIQFGRGDPDQDAQLFAMTGTADARAPDVNKSWPRWAQSMDTNRDGDISQDEFPGTTNQFNQLDKNADGFIDSDELSPVPQ